jgi:3-deoxy-manno-octulosonate cytidylyltransferase (CMP-KDO synthetase)
MNILGIIPARYASTRFPGKPLAVINGKSMIQRVYEQAIKSKKLNWLVVATDDERIFNHIREFGGMVMMSSDKHQNGTSRCLEILNKIEKENERISIDAVINIQGDEPFIKPEQIDMLASLFEDKNTDIATLIKEIKNSETLFDENVVKTVKSKNNFALYFSRLPIPFGRGVNKEKWLHSKKYYKHIGIYGYRNKVLKEIVNLPESPLEKSEKLEQLRWLENSYKIKVKETDFESISVDTPDDLKIISKTY